MIGHPGPRTEVVSLELDIILQTNSKQDRDGQLVGRNIEIDNRKSPWRWAVADCRELESIILVRQDGCGGRVLTRSLII